MKISQRVVDFSTKHYKFITIAMVLFTLITAAFIPLIKVDTDPENMLSKDEAVRVFHNLNKKDFSLSDIVVLGIVNNTDPNGVFNVSSLQKIYQLTEFAKTLRWQDKEDSGKTAGVIEVDIIAPSEVDHIENVDQGTIKFEWLMKQPPQTAADAEAVKEKLLSNPLFMGTVVSEDQKAICVYLPLTDKHLSYRVYSELRKEIANFNGEEEFFITGLPVAEDTFGVEMFIQMAISAPLAMLVIFILMLIFFKKLILVISPMIVAMVSVLSTMGLLIGFGFPVHIMSSMIPIFLMPIAVVDSIHILSVFFDLYTPAKGRRETIREVMKELFTPMLYTSLTSSAGFLSLALTPIPPVQVFGIFVAVGIMIAWLFTITFVPAYVMFIDEKKLLNFGHSAMTQEKENWLTKALHKTGGFTYNYAKSIIVAIVIVIAIAIYGITQIQINDNPVKWFSKSHPIRQADIELNKHFGGTYMAYLVLSDNSDPNINSEFIEQVNNVLKQTTADYPDAKNTAELILNHTKDISAKTKPEYLDKIIANFNKKSQDAKDDTVSEIYYESAAALEQFQENLKIFKQPAMLNYITKLQEYLQANSMVGKSNSVSDIVKKVHQELIDGKAENYKIPDSSNAVAQCLLQFQSSHNPEDLWHFIDYDYSKANIWLQLKSGDNKDMENVVKQAKKFFNDNPPPAAISKNWAGLTYINIVWQDKMVWGMLQSFLGSFLIVFIMMSILFRSPLWGIICMIPLTVTIILIYGVIGLIGKDYDMPVAVLSALTLGMAVDFAIHFLERARSSYKQTGSWQVSAAQMFAEPARAISRNVIVIAVGFLPLLAAPLVPYKTVGIFLCAIMAISGIVTLIVLPAMIKVFEKRLFKEKAAKHPTCQCGFCIIISITAVVLVMLNLHQYMHIGVTQLTYYSMAAVIVLAAVCSFLSRRKNCKIEKKD